MDKVILKKRSYLKNIKCKQFRQMQFAKNSIILRKNQSFRHIYLLKSGQAAIYSQQNPDFILHRYKQGDYLNTIETCTEVNSFKTIKAISRCQILLLIWNKEHQDQERKNKFIPKLQQLKFYQISIFKNLSYSMMLELVSHFNKTVVSKYQINNFIKKSQDLTCFIISGCLVLQGKRKKPLKQIENLVKTVSCHAQVSKANSIKQKNLKLIKFQRGEMIFIGNQNKYQYLSQSDKCEIISINTNLLNYILDQETVQKIKKLKQTQQMNLISRQSKTLKVIKNISKSIGRMNSKSQFIPEKFKNQIENKCQKFQKARSVHYTKNNKDFRSYSDEKRRIIQQRDKGYKQISELNRRKYGRNYIYEKRLQISRNIHGDDFVENTKNQTIRNSQSDSAFKRGVTVYQSVTLKDDYGIMKQSPLMKMIRRNLSRQKKSYASQHVSPYKKQKNQLQIQNITLKSVQKIRKTFQDKSKSLLRNYQKKQMDLQS